MKINTKRVTSMLMLCAAITLTGCASSPKLLDSKYVRGDHIRTDNGKKSVVDTKTLLTLTSNQVTVKEKIRYKRTDTYTYEKILRNRYKQDQGADPGDVIIATIITPFTIYMDLFTLFGLTVGEFMPFTSMAWEDVVDGNTRYYSTDTVLPSSNIAKYESSKSTSTKSISGTKVNLYFNNNYVSTVQTDKNGHARYNPVDLLMLSKIHPKDLIHGDGIKVTATKGQTQSSITLKNKDIPDEYFAQKFNQLRAELFKREARVENCQAISQNYREIFECFYQRM